MCTWNDDTPAIVPAGARISAGKFGSVARSLPNAAESSVNRSPTSCMPSPESPAKRMTTRSRVSAREGAGVSMVTVDLFLSCSHNERPARDPQHTPACLDGARWNGSRDVDRTPGVHNFRDTIGIETADLRAEGRYRPVT